MSELIKINLSDNEHDAWPSFLREAINDRNKFCLEIESKRNLTDLSDFLYFSNGRLFYHSVLLGDMSFDFEEAFRYHQRQNYALTKEPLARSLGIKGSERPYIWDTTCGTGKDSLLIHFFGSKLCSFERHPGIYLLLKDAERRFPLGFEIVFADASQLFPTIGEELRPDVIYYDPMYPEKSGSKKSALPRKEMRIFKDVVGEDNDSSAFLDWALKTARSRVVIKRSLSALPIKEKPTASYCGKSTRYDMYKVF